MKNYIKKGITLLLALSMLLGMAPAISFHSHAASNFEGTFEGQEADVFSALGFDTSEIPEGYDADTTENPYGRDISVGNQVFELLNTSPQGMAIYGKDNNHVATSSIKGRPNGGGGVPLGMFAVAAGDFDGDGLPGEAVYVGFKAGEIRYGNHGAASNIYMAIYDAETGAYSGLKTIGDTNPAWVVTKGGGAYSNFDYAWQNMLQVSAGDYDGDGTMEIAAYVGEDGNSRVDIFKYQKTSQSGDRDWMDTGNWERVWSHVLSNTENQIPNMVSLVSGDFNRDGVDDLGVSCGRFAPYGSSAVTMDKSRAMVLWGGKSRMLQSYTTLNLDESSLGELTRVSLIKGDLDGDGYQELIATGHPMKDLYNYQTDYKDVALYETNTERSITTYIYDAAMGLVINYSAVHKVVEGSMNLMDVNDEQKYIWQSGNGFDQQCFSQPLMRTNAAVFHPEGADYNYLYLDSYLYECTEGQLSLKASLDEGGNVYNGENTLKVSSNVVNGHWGTNRPSAYAPETALHYSTHYAEYGAVGGDLSGKGNAILATSFFRADSKEKDAKGDHFASFGVLSGSSDGTLEISMTMDVTSLHDTVVETLVPTVPVLVDADMDTVLLEYTGEHNLSYSDPEVLAVIAAAPYFEDVDRVYGYDYAWQNTTSFSDFEGDGSGELVSVNFEVGAFLESSLTAGGGNASFAINTMFTLDWEKETSTTKQYTMTFETSQDEDAVAFYCIPTENYVYNVYTPNGAGGYNVEKEVISRTFSPAFQVLNLDYYESIRKDYAELPEIKGKVITSTPGDPSSYPSSTAGYDVIAEWNKEPAGVSFGNGSITQEITITKETVETTNLGGAVEWKLGGGGHVQSDLVQAEVSVIAGAQWTINPANGSSEINLEGTTISGTVTNMPLQFRDYGYYYTWKLFSYALDMGDGSSIPVVSYVVGDVSQPPQLPTDFQQDFDRSTSNSNVLTWTYPDTFSKFYIYRYFDFPVGGGLQLVKEIPSSTADYTVKYDENGKPYKEYFFEDTNLAPYTEYEYSIQVERLSEIPPLSTPSEIYVARTKAAKGYPVMNMVESDKENDGKLLVYPDKTSQLAVDVTGPNGEAPLDYYTTVQYQWQTKQDGAWTDVVNETGKAISFKQAGANVAGEYRCRVNVLTKSDNTAITAYSNPVSLTHSYRSSYVEEFYVHDVAGGGVELFVKVANGHADSASIPSGLVTFNVTENATGKNYQYTAALNTAGVINVLLEESLPAGMYTATVDYKGSTIFKPSRGETLYLSQRLSGYDIDVPAKLLYGEGGELVFRNVTKAGGITSYVEAPAAFYSLMKGDKLTAVSISGASMITDGSSVSAGKSYYLVIDEAKYYFTASHSGTLKLEELYATYGQSNEYLNYFGAGGTYEIAENLPAGGYVLKMQGDDGSFVYNTFSITPRPITLQLPTQQSGEGTANEGDSTDAPSVLMKELELLAGSFAPCDLTEDGDLKGEIGNKNIYINYINLAGTVFSRWSVDGQCGYYIMHAQEANRPNFPNYDITFLDGSMTILGATREVQMGVRPFEGQQVGSLYVLSPEYGLTRAQITDADAMAINHPTGTRLVFSAVPDEGYEIYDWYINGIAQNTKESSLAYVLLAEDTTVEVQFAVKQNSLIFGTAGDKEGGTIICSDPDITSDSSVLANSHFFFYAKAKEGYHFKEWRYTQRGKGTAYDDTDYGDMESSFELLMPQASCSVYAVFERDFYKLEYKDRSENDGLTAWYMGSATGDATAEPERIYVESGEYVKGDTVVTVGPKPGYAVIENQAYVSEGSQGETKDGTYVFSIKEDTTVTGAAQQEFFSFLVTLDVTTHDVFPQGTMIHYTAGERSGSYTYTEEEPFLALENIPGGTEVTAKLEYPAYYDLWGAAPLALGGTIRCTKEPIPKAIRAKEGDLLTKGQAYFMDEHHGQGATGYTTWFFVADKDGLVTFNKTFSMDATIWDMRDEIQIPAISENTMMTYKLTEKETHTVTMSDIGDKGTYSLEIPEGAYSTAGANGTTLVTVHDGDNFTVLVTPAQKWTVSYWRTKPQDGETVQVRASSLKYTIPAITKDFEFTPIFSSTTYNTITWPEIAESKNALTLSPLSGYISSVSAGNDFKFKLSGATLNMIEQVFANGEPFVAADQTSQNLTYAGNGKDRVYTISDIQQNTVITVKLRDVGVTVNGTDIISLVGAGWKYDPSQQVLSLSRSNLNISGISQQYAPNLIIQAGPEVVSMVMSDLLLDPKSGSSTTRTAITTYADKVTITVNGTDNFIEGAIVGKEIVFRGTGILSVENMDNAAIQGDILTLLGTVRLELIKTSKGKSANSINVTTLNLGAKNSASAAPTLKTDACVRADTVNAYGGNLISKSSTYAIRCKTLNSYGGIMELYSGSTAQVVYVDNGGQGWRAYSGGYVATYAKDDAERQTEVKASNEYSHSNYHLIASYGTSGLNSNTFLRYNPMQGTGGMLILEVRIDGTTYAREIPQYNGEGMIYYYIDPETGTIETTNEASGYTRSKAKMEKWKVIAHQDSGTLKLQGYDINFKVLGREAEFWFEESQTVTYDYTLTGKTPMRTEDGNQYGLGIDTHTGTVGTVTFRDFTSMESVVTLRTERKTYFLGDNYIQRSGASPISIQVLERGDPSILSFVGDGYSTLTIVGGDHWGALTGHALHMGGMKYVTIINPNGRPMQFHGGWSSGLFTSTLGFFDYGATADFGGYEFVTQLNYGSGWRQEVGTSAADATVLDGPDSAPSVDTRYTRIYGVTVDAQLTPKEIIHDRDKETDNYSIGIRVPVRLGTVHHPVGAYVTDSEGNRTDIPISNFFHAMSSTNGAEAESATDIFYMGYYFGQSMSLYLESGSTFSQLPDGAYTLRVDFYDEDPSDATYYYDEISLIITHGELSDDNMSISPLTATAGRGQDVSFTATYEGRIPSRYIWYVDGVALEGQTKNSLTYTVPEDAALNENLEIRCEAYEGDKLLGYSGAIVAVCPAAVSIDISAADMEKQEDGSYLVSHMPQGMSLNFSALVTMNDESTNSQVSWSLWGNTLNSTTLSQEGLLTIDPAETGTRDHLIVTATHRNADGTTFAQGIIIWLSTDAYIIYSSQAEEFGSITGVSADGEALLPDGAYAPAGSTVVVTAQPAEGKQVTQWLVNDEAVTAGELYQIDNRNYTLTFIAKAMSQYDIVAVYEDKTHVILDYAAGENGKLSAASGEASVAPGGLVPMGSDVILTALPDELYTVKAWYIDGEPVEGHTDTTLTLTALTADRNVTVEFEPMTRKVEISIEFGGSVLVTDSAGRSLTGENGIYTIAATEKLNITATAMEGFLFQAWALNSPENIVQTEIAAYILEPGAEDVTLWAIFEALDHVHDYTVEIVAPTCTSLGYTIHTCACGHSYKTDYIAAVGHSYEETVIDPTCTTMGYTVYACSCGDSYTDRYIDALGHSYTQEVIPPSCTALGYTLYSCFCGHSIQDNFVAKLDHSYQEELTIEPSCVEEGQYTYTCSCGDSYTVAISKVEHEYASQIIEPTCTELGYTLYTCSCGDSYKTDYAATIPHTYTSSEVAPTCGSLGYTEFVCSCGHSYKTDYVAAIAHSYEQVITAPTHDGLGYTTYTCSCGYSYKSDYVDALGHSYEALVTEPTCLAEGYTLYSCSCGHSYISDIVEAVGHSFTSAVTEPTHETMGYTTHTCSCGYSCIDSYTAALEHEYEMSVTLEPGCTSEGEMTFTCSCGSSYTQPIPKAEHVYAPAVTEPTCTSMGYTTYTCSCGESYIANYTDAKEHDLEQTTVEPGCMVGGYTQVKCSDCDYCAVTQITEPTGEHAVVTVGAVEATYIQDGYTGDQLCEHCGTVIQVGRIIPMIMEVEIYFEDVPEDAWYADAVEYVVSRGLMMGVGDNLFAPDRETNRAMMVTLLYRLAGSPDVSDIENPFTDVEEGIWYYAPVLWAYSEGVVKGVSDTLYAPDRTISREQLVTMLYRYAGEPEANEEALAAFVDGDTVSAYARAAMSWAIEKGLIAGMKENGNSVLKPLNTATRAQIAAIFMRYCES